MASSPSGSPPPSLASPPSASTSPPSNSSTPSPPPQAAVSPPPESPPSTPPPSPPPSPPASPPPTVLPPPASPPPSPPAAPPPSSPPSPVVTSPPPPSAGGLPPRAAAQPPPAAAPPTSQSSPPPPSRAISPSPPSPSPPSDVPSPPSSKPSPPPESPANLPSPPPAPTSEAPSTTPSGPASSPPSPPSVPSSSPPSPPSVPSSSPPSPPSVPSTSKPPASSPPAPPSNSSTSASPAGPPLPSIPTEKPTARSTNDTTVNANSTAGGLKTGGAVAIGIVVGFVVLSLLVMAVWFMQRRKRKNKQSNIGYKFNMPSPFASSQNSESVFLRSHSPVVLAGSASGSNFMYSPSEQGAINNSRSWFTYEELLHATDGFSSLNILGEGGFGCVYKGVLADGREVAVKQLKIGSGQGEREFRAEVEIISRVHHRHLVSLVGYCIVEQHRLLVYDYVPNNTLHYHLHGHPRIIHRDIKSSNILLDNNFDAQ
ncbi:hypothetical protein CRG98_003998, partial [Punica granatum]